MFGKTIKLFTLFGFDVRIDLSWLIIAFLVAWSLSSGYFPRFYPDFSRSTYWTMGIVGTLGLFFSILFHEFWHSLVARGYGLPMHGITLFLFGGVSEMREEPPSARVEFLVAIAGPVSSVILGFVFAGLSSLAQGWGVPMQVSGVIKYLALINWIVAGFNMLPAFPLDGGRIVRSAVWKWTGDLREATKAASYTGVFFGILLVIFGAVNMLAGNLIGGMWYVIIGLFIRGTAQMSYKQLVMQRSLRGKKVRDYMNDSPVTVPAGASIRELVQDYMYKYHFKTFPVMRGERLQGCVHSKQIKYLDEGEWDRRSVAELGSGCSQENTVSGDTDVMDALEKMQRTGNSRLLVVEGGELAGIISMKDILTYLRYHTDFEEDSP